MILDILMNKLAKLRRHASRVHFAKILVGYVLELAFKPSYTFFLGGGGSHQKRLLHRNVGGNGNSKTRRCTTVRDSEGQAIPSNGGSDWSVWVMGKWSTQCVSG